MESYCSQGRLQWGYVQPVYAGSSQAQEYPPADAPVGDGHDVTFYLHQLGERSLVADSQRGEIAALHAQVEAHKVSVTDHERAVVETENRLARERADADVAGQELAEARGRLGDLGTRASELERQLFVQQTEAEVLNRRVQELENRLGEQGRMLAERDYQVDRMRSELDAARTVEADLRSELSASGWPGTAA